MNIENKHVGPSVYFENNDWAVNQYGLINKAGKCEPVTWDEIKTFHSLEIKTCHPFLIQPWPFWGSTKKEAWFNYETYKEAFCFALGFETLRQHNAKAVKHYVALHPNL